MTNFQNLESIFNLGRNVIEPGDNKYTQFAFDTKLNNYKLITSGELLIKGLNLNIPDYMKEFITFHGDAIMIANKIDNRIISLLLRSIHTKKEFMKIGITKSLFYGLGDLGNFKYGDLILLVEGQLDRDVMAKWVYPYTLSVTTNMLSKSQLKVLSCLTNKVVLMLDNDEAGRNGILKSKKDLMRLGINTYILNHEFGMKDAGDLINLKKYNIVEYNYAINTYKNLIRSYGGNYDI